MSVETLHDNGEEIKVEGNNQNEVLSKIEEMCKLWMPEDEHYVLMSTNILKKTFNYFGSTVAASFVAENDSFVKTFIQHCYNSVLKPNERTSPITVEETDQNLTKEIDNIIENLDMKNEISAETCERNSLISNENISEAEEVGNNVIVKTDPNHDLSDESCDNVVNDADYVNNSSDTDDYEVETEMIGKVISSGEKNILEHKCSKCKHAFQTNALLQNHIKEHDIFDGQKRNDNSCPECSKVFSNRRILKRHYRTHSKIRLYECTICDKTFARSDVYKAHMNIHEEPKWECSQCGRHYFTKKSLAKHVKICINSNRLKCNTCKIHFRDKENFDMHICHSEEPNNLSKTYQSGTTEDGRHICGICNKIFNKRKGLLNHRKLHSEQYRNNVCEICNKNFNTKEILKNHVKYVHSETKDFVCELCGKRFTRADGLKLHSQTHYPNKREKFACSVCGQFLASQRSLDIHMRIHENIVPFVCETCGKSFRQQSNLKSHIINVHTEEANYQCEKCPKKLKSRALWKVHMRFHACKEGIDVVNASSLGKFYTCNVCLKTFATATQLKTHTRTHSNERPYGCSICMKFFKERSKLMRHSKTVHSGLGTESVLMKPSTI